LIKEELLEIEKEVQSILSKHYGIHIHDWNKFHDGLEKKFGGDKYALTQRNKIQG
jgi:hypothetical protein